MISFEERIKAYDALKRKIDALEEERKDLMRAILQQMPEKKIEVAGYIVRRCTHFSIKLSLAEARAIDAIKIEEVIDKKKIKALYQLGKLVEGVSETEYLRLSKETLEEQHETY